MTEEEVQAAIIAVCPHPECRTQASALQWIVTQGTRPNAGVGYRDEQSLWELLHAIRQHAIDGGRKQYAVKIGSSRYELWLQRTGMIRVLGPIIAKDKVDIL
jgi:hypothetical protein